MSGRPDTKDETESRRILDRVARETEGGGTMFGRAVNRVRDHASARDADQDDWVELWGTRIGRALGLGVVLGLLVWLAVFLARGG